MKPVFWAHGFVARFVLGLILCGGGMPLLAETGVASASADYEQMEKVWVKHCLDCHSAQDPEGELVMESYAELLKGGRSGAAIVPGKSGSSLLVRMVEGKYEKDGKTIIMPPGKREKLTADEIARVRAWIDGGAVGPKDPLARTRVDLAVPEIAPIHGKPSPIKGLAYSPGGKWLAAARHGEVEIYSAPDRWLARRLTGHVGAVNAVAFSPDGAYLFAAAGRAGLSGEVRIWNVAEGKLARVLEGHRDAVYSLAAAPRSNVLATGSYDQKIKLWNWETGQELRTLSGHNGAVFDLSFRSDGKILASASADRTVKLWDAATGERRETLAQSLKELNAVAFSPDGKRLAAGGVDNRIRVWEVSESAAETTNPLLEARFAHEGAILRLAFSPDGKSILSAADDRTVKVWDAASIRERVVFEKQPDWALAVAWTADNKGAAVGRFDGSIEYYDAASGKALPPPKPELTRAEPRGVQRGTRSKLRLLGANLRGVKEVKSHHAKVQAALIGEEEAEANSLWVEVLAADDLTREGYELSVAGDHGESGRVKIFVDDLPQRQARSGEGQAAGSLPVSLWGAHEKTGAAEEFRFRAERGESLVFDLAAKSLGSKASVVLTLMDGEGRVLATSQGFDTVGDPLLAHTFAEEGDYRLRVHELLLGASADHFYRLSIGSLPMVTGIFPVSMPSHATAEIQLIGHHLGEKTMVTVKSENPGELDLPLPDHFRSRRKHKVLVSDFPSRQEAEPNDNPASATVMAVPGAVDGRLGGAGRVEDADLFRFEAKAGKTLVLETLAAQRGSPADTRLEILMQDGKPAPRLKLQAVRNSAITFRGIDSNAADCRVENWEEMELNQFLYLQGEVVKLFRAPQGPDSGFVFYTSNGRRRTFFDTSATVHATDEPCYIVEPHPPEAKLADNGLPVFSLFFENDDDGERRLGTDSKIYFDPPKDGTYLARVTDTRGFGGARYVYRLVVREAKPDFRVVLNGANPTVNAGSGQSFSAAVERVDGFNEEVRVEITGLPSGFSVSSPLVIEAGHSEARGTLMAAADALAPDEAGGSASKVTATAMLGGTLATREVNGFGRIRLGGPPKLFVALEPDAASMIASGAPAAAEGKDGEGYGNRSPLEIVIGPGQTIPAWLRVRRNGHEDLVTFTVENLPHGVIVDNIGLNGVLMPKGENERQIFLTAAKWVPETDRPCFAVENQAGRQTSIPVLLKVRKPGGR